MKCDLIWQGDIMAVGLVGVLSMSKHHYKLLESPRDQAKVTEASERLE